VSEGWGEGEGVEHEGRAFGERVVAGRSQSPDAKVKGADRYGPGDDRRAGGPERAKPGVHRDDRFFVKRPEDKAARRSRRCGRRDRRTDAVPKRKDDHQARNADWGGWSGWKREDEVFPGHARGNV